VTGSRPDRSEVIRELREKVFAVSPEDLAVAPGRGHQYVWAVLMETGYPEAVVSLVVIADGTTSLYFSNGGGVIGAGEHADVRAASARLIALVDTRTAEFELAQEHPLPKAGRVKFYVLTFDGLRTFEAPEKDLGEHRHHLSDVFHAAHAVISAIRESEERRT
jgi:hypothetical protein